MSLPLMVRKGLVAAAALGVLVVGGAALAMAMSGGSSHGQPRDNPAVLAGDRGDSGKLEAALPPAAAARVKAAAEAEIKNGKVERVETDTDHGLPYEAHARLTDGTELEVLVDKHFTVTAVNTLDEP